MYYYGSVEDYAEYNCCCPEAKSKVPDWGDNVDSGHRVKVDSGKGLLMVNVLESTLV